VRLPLKEPQLRPAQMRPSRERTAHSSRCNSLIRCLLRSRADASRGQSARERTAAFRQKTSCAARRPTGARLPPQNSQQQELWKPDPRKLDYVTTRNLRRNMGRLKQQQRASSRGCNSSARQQAIGLENWNHLRFGHKPVARWETLMETYLDY